MEGYRLDQCWAIHPFYSPCDLGVFGSVSASSVIESLSVGGLSPSSVTESLGAVGRLLWGD